MALDDYKMGEADLAQMNNLFEEVLEGPAAELVSELRGCLPKEIPYGFACFLSSNFERLV